MSKLKRAALISLLGMLGPISGQASEQESLEAREKAIIPIAALTASGNLENLEASLRDGLEAGLTISEIKEVLVQMYAYAGFPRSLNGIHVFMNVLEDRKAKGIKDAPGPEASPLPKDANMLQIGTENQTKLLGAPATGAYIEFSPTIDYFLKAHLFGDIFARDILSFQDRELATVAALASMKGTVPQLKAHLRFSMNVGLSGAQLAELADVLEDRVSEASAEVARESLAEILQAALEKKDSSE